MKPMCSLWRPRVPVLTKGVAAPASWRPLVMADAVMTIREQAAWAVLDGVPDPEVPVLSVCDLGIVREVRADETGTQVVLTPTYSGCPATEVIAASVRDALVAAGLGPVTLTHRLAPAWTTDWISPEGRRKLREYGIAPPSGLASVASLKISVISASQAACRSDAAGPNPLARAAAQPNRAAVAKPR